MTDDEQDFFNKNIGKLEKEIIALKKEYQAECNRADELEDSLQTSWQNESKLKKQLEIAVKKLEEYGNRVNWDKDGMSFGKYTKGWILANKALTKIKEIK